MCSVFIFFIYHCFQAIAIGQLLPGQAGDWCEVVVALEIRALRVNMRPHMQCFTCVGDKAWRGCYRPRVYGDHVVEKNETQLRLSFHSLVNIWLCGSRLPVAHSSVHWAAPQLIVLVGTQSGLNERRLNRLEAFDEGQSRLANPLFLKRKPLWESDNQTTPGLRGSRTRGSLVAILPLG